MTDPILPETTLTAHDPLIRQLTRGLNQTDPEHTDHAVYGPALRYYLAFTFPAVRQAVGLADLSDQAVFYNRYYWLLTFTQLWIQQRGPDAGAEQQVFQLLEYADCQPDWEMVEQIHNRVMQRFPRA